MWTGIISAAFVSSSAYVCDRSVAVNCIDCSLLCIKFFAALDVNDQGVCRRDALRRTDAEIAAADKEHELQMYQSAQASLISIRLCGLLTRIITR